MICYEKKYNQKIFRRVVFDFLRFLQIFLRSGFNRRYLDSHVCFCISIQCHVTYYVPSGKLLSQKRMNEKDTTSAFSWKLFWPDRPLERNPLTTLSMSELVHKMLFTCCELCLLRFPLLALTTLTLEFKKS